MEYVINLKELSKYLLKRWKVLLISAIVFGFLAAGYSVVKTKTYYKASSVIQVIAEDAKNPVQNTNIINRDDVITYSINKSSVNTSVSTVKNNITISRYSYSNDIVIGYNSLNKQEATSLLNILISYAVSTINEVPGYSVSIKETAQLVGTFKTGPSLIKLAIVGLLIGGFLSAFVLAVKYVLDNKIRDTDFIEVSLKYNVLTNVGSIEKDIKKLLTNLLYGFGDVKMLAVSGFGNDAKIIAENLSNYLSCVKGNVLWLTDEGDEGIEELSSRINKEIKRCKKGVDRVAYNDIESATTYFLSDESKDLISKLKKQYDYIVISTPIESAKSVSTIFNAICDGTLLVVKKDETRIEDIIELKKQLEIIKAEVLGVVYIS